MSETVTVRVGRAEISVPAEDVAQHIIASLTGQQAALATTAPPKTGEPWPGQGGIYAGMMRNPGGRDYHLIYPTAEMGGEHESVRWSEDDDADIDGADNEWDGLKNTRALVESDADCPAAEWAAGLVIEGHADYYLPSRRELALAWGQHSRALRQGVALVEYAALVQRCLRSALRQWLPELQLQRL